MASRIINSQYISCGWHGYPGHLGVDLLSGIPIAQGGIPRIKSHSAGEVVEILNNNYLYGNSVHVKTGDYTLEYSHLAGIEVKVGQKLAEGEELGTMGNTGTSRGMHLHFGVRTSGGTLIDPTPYLNADLPNAPSEITPAKTTTYVVKTGDTFNQIAINYKMTPDELKALNPQIENTGLIYAGQVLNVDTPHETGTYEVTASVLTVRTSPEVKEDNWLKFEDLTENAQEQILKLNNNVKVNGYCKGVRFDATEISADGNWGKSASGWCHLDYCKKD